MNPIKHWKLTRITSVPLAVLFFYFLEQMPEFLTQSRILAVGWVKQPTTTCALIIFIVCGFWHAQLGMEEIIIDYVTSEKLQKLSLCVNKLVFLVLGLACLYATLAISFGNF
jgi:succinate dehydrogenase / fumarate reductase membrane anchor subunit